MAFTVKWTYKAKKSMEKLERETIVRIIKRVEETKKNPFLYMKWLKEMKIWRLRIGDYRILIDLDTEKEVLYVLEVGHRKSIYKG